MARFDVRSIAAASALFPLVGKVLSIDCTSYDIIRSATTEFTIIIFRKIIIRKYLISCKLRELVNNVHVAHIDGCRCGIYIGRAMECVLRMWVPSA